MFIIKKASAFTTEELSELGLTGIPSEWPIVISPIEDPVPLGYVSISQADLDLLKQNNQASYDAWLASKMTVLPDPAPLQVAMLGPKDSDGSSIYKYKVTQSGWSVRNRCIKFSTSVANSIHNKNHLDQDLADATVKFYNLNNVETTDMSLCVKTVMDFEPVYPYDIIGGSVFIKNPPVNSSYVYVVAVPDVPIHMGGSIQLLDGGMDLSFFETKGKFVLDGRGGKRMVPDSQYHTSKIRCIVNHTAGEITHIQFLFDKFAA